MNSKLVFFIVAILILSTATACSSGPGSSQGLRNRHKNPGRSRQ